MHFFRSAFGRSCRKGSSGISFMKKLRLGAIETHVADARTCVLNPATSTVTDQVFYGTCPRC